MSESMSVSNRYGRKRSRLDQKRDPDNGISSAVRNVTDLRCKRDHVYPLSNRPISDFHKVLVVR